MPARAFRRRFAILAGAAALLCGALPSRATDVSLSTVVGIGARYRPDTWIPVTVTVKNRSADSLRGQVQILAEPVGSNQGQNPGQARPAAVYAAPLLIPPDNGVPHTVTIYVRNMDPIRDNLTVQYVDGEERGGGQVFAEQSAVTSTRANAVVGTPVNGSDLFLVGVADDPNAFNFLRGQEWGLLHTRGGALSVNAFPPLPNNGYPAYPTAGAQVSSAQSAKMTPGTIEVGSAAASSLPDRPAGYSGVDAVLFHADTSLDQLTEAQVQALKSWVASGGRLVIIDGPTAASLPASGLADLLPAGISAASETVTVAGAGRVTAAALLPKSGAFPLLAAHGGAPLAFAKRYGAGLVTLVGTDLTSAPFQGLSHAQAAALWAPIVTGGEERPVSLTSYVAQYEEGAVSGYGAQSRLSDAVLRIAAFNAPSTATVALFLLIYVVVLVPLNYLVLKRMDRREWAWLSIPGLVFLFAAGTYAAGYITRGTSQFVNRVALLETSAGSRVAGSYDVFGFFSSRRASYDIGVRDSDALVSIPAMPRYNYYGMADQVNTYGAARFVQTGSGVQIQDASIDMWAMRTFDSQSSRDLGGSVDASLKKYGANVYTGTVTNNTGRLLKNCCVLCGQNRTDIGDFKPGASVSVSLSVPRPPAVLPAGGLFDNVMTSFDSANATVDDRMSAGTLEFLRGIGQDNGGYGYGYGYGNTGLNDEPLPPLKSSSDEALLIGWSQDDALFGPPIQVDGRPSLENRVALVAVHIPLPK